MWSLGAKQGLMANLRYPVGIVRPPPQYIAVRELGFGRDGAGMGRQCRLPLGFRLAVMLPGWFSGA